jgi:hypothetical protein
MTIERTGGLERVLDQIHSNRDARLPLEERIPTYLDAAREAIRTPGVRHEALEFVGLAVKARVTTVFQAGVEHLLQVEPKINDAIDRTSDLVVRGIDRVTGRK